MQDWFNMATKDKEKNSTVQFLTAYSSTAYSSIALCPSNASTPNFPGVASTSPGVESFSHCSD